MDENTKRGRGRPRKTEEEKQKTKELAAQRKKERERLGLQTKFGLENVQPGDNSKFIAHALRVQAMPPIDYSDPVQVERRIGEYFQLCFENDMKPSATGFRMAIGVSKQTISSWRSGEYREGTHQEVIIRGYNMLEALWEDYMQNGKINPVAGIFLGKNNWGYRDQQDVVVTPNTQIETIDVATIEEKYAELPDVED